LVPLRVAAMKTARGLISAIRLNFQSPPVDS
jgi:hypothetical protein